MSRLPTLFLSHGSPMNGIEQTPSSRAWAALGRELPKPRAVLVASAHWETSVPMLTGQSEARDDPRFRRIPRAAVPDPLPGARCAGARRRGRRAAEGRRYHRGRERLSRARSRRVGAAALDVPRQRRARRRDLAATGARHGAPRGARARAGAARRRWRADRGLGSRDAQPARLDGEPAAPRTVALRAGVRRLAAASGWPRATPMRWSRTATSPRKRPARIRPKSTSCRCSSRGAPPAMAHAPNASARASKAARSRTTGTSSTRAALRTEARVRHRHSNPAFARRVRAAAPVSSSAKRRASPGSRACAHTATE